MDRRFENVVPQAPASFDCAVERALHETEVEAMNRRKFSISLAWVIVALLALAGAAVAVSDHFGILDFLSLNPVKDEDGAPEIDAEYVGMEMTIGGYEMELTEYYYEGDRITLMLTSEPLADEALSDDVFSVQVDGYEDISMNTSEWQNASQGAAYCLVTAMLSDGGRDTETVRIADVSDPANEYVIQVARSASSTGPLIKAEISDASIEDAGITVTGCDVEQTALTTVLTVYCAVDPAAMDLTVHSDVPRYYREGDTWHTDSECGYLEAPLEEPNCCAVEIFGEALNACECAEGWDEMMREDFDLVESPGRLRLDIVDENGESGFGAGRIGYDDSDGQLTYYIGLEIDNTMLNQLPDVLYIRALDFYENWKFEDVAAINVEVLKGE